MLAPPWNYWKEKRQSSFCLHCGLQIRQILIWLITVCGILQEEVFKTRITDLDDLKHRIRIRTQ